MSCWKARGERLKLRWDPAASTGSAGMHKWGTEVATPYACPFPSIHCAATPALALCPSRGSLIPELARPILCHPLALPTAGGCPQVNGGRSLTGCVLPHAHLSCQSPGNTQSSWSCQAPSPPTPSAHTKTRCQEVMSAPQAGEVGGCVGDGGCSARGQG